MIVDDEPLALELLEKYVEATPFLRLQGSYGSALAVLEALRGCPVDLLFCDIQMPGLNGIELSRLLPAGTRVVFTTAFDTYAVEGFRVNAVDYLLKPIDKTELSKMLKRFVEKAEEQRMQPIPFHVQLRSLLPLEQTIIIPSPTNDLQFLRPENVGFFKYNSARKQWEAYLNNVSTPAAIRKNISAEQILESSPSFVQIHQSYIININYLIMIKDKKCVFYPPFDHIRDLQISKLYLKKLQDRFLML